jgi:23S rRNA (adenine2503-C2)-methyltransferase
MLAYCQLFPYIFNMAKINVLGFTRREFEDLVMVKGEQRYRGRQIYRWLYVRRCTDFQEMSDLSKDLRSYLTEKTEVLLPQVEEVLISNDGPTRKFRLVLADGIKIETVLMKEKERITVCISTQVGCALGCRFCATGMMVFKRNLTAGEIVGQYLVAGNHSEERITNIVMMGMGEPLLNYANVSKAIGIFSDHDGIGISGRKITLSTAGIIPGIDRVTQERLSCKLAVSLNAPEDELRTSLMPINQKFPLSELLPALHRYEKSSRHRVTFEYVLMKGVNDSVQHAQRLKRLLGGFTAKLNLIPYNQAKELAGEQLKGNELNNFQTPEESAVADFAQEVWRPGLFVNIRKSLGSDIKAACGQLAATEKGISGAGEY